MIVPIRRTLRFDAVREMARVIAGGLVRDNAGGVTLEWDIGRRRGKVFVDANMNVRGKSMIAPWSPRGLPGAPVSMPLTWRRLKDANSMEFRIPTAAGSLHSQGDPWRDFLGATQSVEDALQVAAD